MIRPGMHVVDCDKMRTGKISSVESNKRLAIVRWHNCSKNVVRFSELYHDIGSGVLEYTDEKKSNQTKPSR